MQVVDISTVDFAPVNTEIWFSHRYYLLPNHEYSSSYFVSTSYPCSLGTSLDQVATINRDVLAVQVLAACGKQNSSSHVLVLARSLRRQSSLVFLWELALLVILALASGHF